MTNKPSSKTERVATVEEISQAIEALRPDDWAKLATFAHNRAEYMRKYGAAVDDTDVLQLAVTSLLAERRTWNPKRVTFVGVLTGAMRSIASNHVRRSKTSGYTVADSQLALNGDNDDEERTLLALYADTRLSVELQMVATEIEADKSTFVEDIYNLFEADAEAQLVMDGWRQGKDGPAIKHDLGIDQKTYETIVKRIRRKSVARWSKGSNYVS